MGRDARRCLPEVGLLAQDKKHRMETVSRLVVSAIVEKAGYQLDVPSNDNGIDGIIREVDFRNCQYFVTPTLIDMQIKSTMQRASLRDGRYSYRLRNKNYNDLALRNQSGGAPIILVVVFFPDLDDVSDLILEDTQNHLTQLHGHVLWYRLDSDSSSLADPDGQTTIHIPATNIFTSDALRDMMTRAKGGLL